jgi:hypothetical protein
MAKTTATHYREVLDDDAYEKALTLARGCYQQNLLRGVESLSGATLKGRAKDYGARYQASRAHLLTRLHAAGIHTSERIAEHGRRVLVIGQAS